MSTRQFTPNQNPNLYVAQGHINNKLQVEVQLLPVIGWLVVRDADDEDWYSPPIPVTPNAEEEPDCIIYDKGADVWVRRVYCGTGEGMGTLRQFFENDAEHRPEEYGLDAPPSAIRAKVMGG